MFVYKLDREGGKQDFVGRASSGAQMVWEKLGMDTPTLLRGKWVKCNDIWR
jgi:hypothetical protein